MEKELSIGALAAAAAGGVAWLFREYGKFLLTRQEKKDDAELARAEADRKDAVEARAKLHEALERQVAELSARVDRMTQQLLEAVSREAKLNEQLAALRDELEETRERCGKCPAQRTAHGA